MVAISQFVTQKKNDAAKARSIHKQTALYPKCVDFTACHQSLTLQRRNLIVRVAELEYDIRPGERRDIATSDSEVGPPCTRLAWNGNKTTPTLHLGPEKAAP